MNYSTTKFDGMWYFSFLMGLTLVFDLLADLLVTPAMVITVEGP